MNSANTIVFYDGQKRVVKTFKDFYYDVSICYSQIASLSPSKELKNIAIVGPTSYGWMVIDWACIWGGYKSIAVPEFLSSAKTTEILTETGATLVLVDKNLNNRISHPGNLSFDPANSRLIDLNGSYLEVPLFKEIETNNVLEFYGVAFSSGTSANLKKINLRFQDLEKPKAFKRFISSIKKLPYLFTFWSGKNNKIIVYLPFSHIQQRNFIRMALMRNINIILSDPQNCIKHIILEKPNIMISVPIIYQVMANRIKTKTEQFSPFQAFLFKTFTNLSLHKLSNENPVKKLFSNFLFKDIKIIYGGRADYFVTGSAPIDTSTLEIFYSVGVKIFEAYGQSENTIISMSSSKNFRIGSVGKPLIKLKIAEDGEIMIPYKKDDLEHNAGVLKIEGDYILTGDLGYLDKDGFLFLKGRKDDVIVLENGKKIFPMDLEERLNKTEGIKQSVIFKAKDVSLAAIIFAPALKHMEPETIKSHINQFINTLANYERIEKIYISNESFSIENGLMTATLKLRRKEIITKFENEKFIILG